MTEHDERLARIHQRLADAVAAITTSEEWVAMLAVAARFRTYSPHNVFLINLAKPDATRVAGYRTWQALGRQVRAGEKGIPILAPVLRRGSLTNRGHGYIDPEDEPAKPVLAGYRFVHVFDIASTDGKPLPEVAPVLLRGDGPEGAFDALADHVRFLGFDVRRAPLEPANGVTDYTAHVVTVAGRLGGAAALKTLAHEAGHAALHGPHAPPGMTRARAEVEAESVAFLVCAELGVSSDDYAFSYVAHWSNGDMELVARTATRAIGAARSILDAVAPAPPNGPAAAAVLDRAEQAEPRYPRAQAVHPRPRRTTRR